VHSPVYSLENTLHKKGAADAAKAKATAVLNLHRNYVIAR